MNDRPLPCVDRPLALLFFKAYPVPTDPPSHCRRGALSPRMLFALSCSRASLCRGVSRSSEEIRTPTVRRGYRHTRETMRPAMARGRPVRVRADLARVTSRPAGPGTGPKIPVAGPLTGASDRDKARTCPFGGNICRAVAERGPRVPTAGPNAFCMKRYAAGRGNIFPVERASCPFAFLLC